MREQPPDYVKLDHEVALALVVDFFSVPDSVAYVDHCLPHIKKAIARSGFQRVKKLVKQGPDFPPYRNVADLMIKDPISAAVMAVAVHNDDPAEAPKLGPRRVERIAAENGGLAALWAALATSFYREKSSRAGFKRALELAREVPGGAVVESQGEENVSEAAGSAGKNHDAAARSPQKEIKRLKKEARQVTKQRDQAVSAKEALDQKYKTANEALREERGLIAETNKRLADAQEKLADAERRATEAEKQVNALLNEQDVFAREREALAAERDVLAQEREALTEQCAGLAREPALEKAPAPRLAARVPQDLRAFNEALTEKLRELAARPELDSRAIGALAGAIEQLNNVIGLDWEDDASALEASVAPGEEPRSRSDAPAITAPDVTRRWDAHNNMKTIERIEARIAKDGAPAKIILDAHNVILRNGFPEAEGRELLEETAPIIAERTGSEVYVIFDTKYGTGTDYGTGCRFIYASKADGKADARIREEAWAADDERVLIFSDDIKHVVADAHDAAAAGKRVRTLETLIMADYIRALGCLNQERRT